MLSLLWPWIFVDCADDFIAWQIGDTIMTKCTVFCFDVDGEVEYFELLPVSEVAKIIRTSQQYKPNCALVVIDFLFRHG